MEKREENQQNGSLTKGRKERTKGMVESVTVAPSAEKMRSVNSKYYYCPHLKE